MKKLQDILFSSALVVAAGASMASCSSSDDIAEAPVNPSFDGENVKTQFAINIATPVTQNKTRMTDVNTQNNNSNFLGMNEIRLIPLTISGNINVTPASGESGSSRSNDIAINQVISLKSLTTEDISSTQSSKIYTDVNIPVGTNRFLFYGVGPMGDTEASNKFKKGHLTFPTVETIDNISDINYNLTPILGTTNMDTEKNAFAAYLNAVANTSVEIEGTTYRWSECKENGTETGKITSASLKALYVNFTASPTNGARAGSANAIKYLMQDLYNVCASISDEKDENGAKTKAAQLAEKIMKNIKDPNLASNNVIKFTASDGSTSPIAYTLEWESNVTDNYKNFPTYYNLPEGSVQLTYTDTGFSYSNNTQIGTTTDLKFDASKVYYPSALTYFVSTPARATTKELGNTEWKTTVNEWDGAWDSSNGEYKDWTMVVNSTSRTVALQYNVNYGVACLKTSVRCKENVTALEDNAQKFKTAETGSNNMITIPSGGFLVKGILIGGQPSKVDWDFINTSNHDAVIYDNIAKANATGSDEAYIGAKSSEQYSTANYTLVFDNYSNGANSNNEEDVYVALEVENNSGQEFYGVDGKVGIGQKFYLVAQLKPNDSTASGSIVWPEDGKADFPAKKITRVFIQDHITEAKFTINSLKYAYVTIPDLRATKMQLGLSVDLSWKNGLTFDVPID